MDPIGFLDLCTLLKRYIGRELGYCPHLASLHNMRHIKGIIWVVVKIVVPFWILFIIRHLVFRVPKKGTIISTTTHIFILQLSSNCYWMGGGYLGKRYSLGSGRAEH